MIPKGDFKLQVIRQCVDTFSTLRSTKEFPKETRGQSEFGFPSRGAVKRGLTFHLVSITSGNRRLKMRTRGPVAWPRTCDVVVGVTSNPRAWRCCQIRFTEKQGWYVSRNSEETNSVWPDFCDGSTVTQLQTGLIQIISRIVIRHFSLIGFVTVWERRQYRKSIAILRHIERGLPELSTKGYICNPYSCAHCNFIDQ